jgi:predicted AAA+ superfamily ATPase
LCVLQDQLRFEWRQEYVATYLERDIPALGIQIPSTTLRRFWLMLLHYHGQVFNASEIGNSLGLSHITMRRYLDILAGTFMIRILPAWQENLGKRQVKAPKIYFRDQGLMHYLSQIETLRDLQISPKLGASWEGFALEELIRARHFRPEECYFWRTHTGAELDLFVLHQGKRLGFEFKYTDQPRVTKSMYSALADLKLDELTIIAPGREKFLLQEKVSVEGLEYAVKDSSQ